MNVKPQEVISTPVQPNRTGSRALRPAPARHRYRKPPVSAAIRLPLPVPRRKCSNWKRACRKFPTSTVRESHLSRHRSTRGLIGSTREDRRQPAQDRKGTALDNEPWATTEHPTGARNRVPATAAGHPRAGARGATGRGHRRREHATAIKMRRWPPGAGHRVASAPGLTVQLRQLGGGPAAIDSPLRKQRTDR